MLLDQLKKRAEQEWEQVKASKAVLALAVITGLSIGWLVNEQFHQERFEIMEQQIAQSSGRGDGVSAPPTQQPSEPLPDNRTSPQPSEAKDVPARKLSAPVNKPPVVAPVVPQISAPGGIAIGGGTVTNPTVNNIVPNPQREISVSQARELIALVKPFSHVKVMIQLHQTNNESTRFGMRLAEVLRSAGVTVVDVQPVMSFGTAGQIPQMAFVVERKAKGQEDLAYLLATALVNMNIVKPPLRVNPPDQNGNPEMLIIDVFPLG